MVGVLFFRNPGSDKSIDTLFGLLGLAIWLAILWGLAKLWLRRRKEKHWPTAVGIITSKQVGAVEDDHGYIYRQRADFRYKIIVNANSWPGEFHSTSTLEDACNADARIIEVGQSVVVRYNPANPEESLVWAKDNPDIPFKLELSEVEFR
ncbi:MAG TPA: DUF3592 domain-containing protein [Candidatus Angelobacter sp.]|nr:DUF3592 domain-containing protein [Candidatus Angelobacter sp.]